MAAELCEHITLFGVPRANKPSAVVACVPTAMEVCLDTAGLVSWSNDRNAVIDGPLANQISVIHAA